MPNSLKFSIDKCNLISKLEQHSNKMKLTNDYIISFDYIINFDKFVYYCNSYNYLINECDSLKKKLLQMNKWGYIFNSKKCWFNKLSSIESSFNLYSNNIMKIYISNFKYKYSHVLDEDFITHQIRIYEKLKIYLKTYKIDNKYTYIDIDNNIYMLIGNCDLI